MSRPPKFQLVDIKLDEDLATFLREQRAEREGQKRRSYDEIAFEIRQRTGIKVTGPTVSNWLDLVADATEDAAGAA